MFISTANFIYLLMQNFSNLQHIFFIGIAGTGMSALAQYCAGIGKTVSGSDRYFGSNAANETQQQLQALSISCYAQDGSGINETTELVVISTAVEDSNIEVQKAKQLNIPIIKRSELLTIISLTKKTIAVGGTSGKSTTTAMIVDILEYANLQPSIISGAGLIRLQEKGLIGNAWVGKGDWLVIEADESDGSIVSYKPEIGLLLNIDKDHKEIDELLTVFKTFKQNSKSFSVNQGNSFAKPFSESVNNDFSLQPSAAKIFAENIVEDGFEIKFSVQQISFVLNTFGLHNAENALAAIAVASMCGVDLETCSEALKNYRGIYRRNQVLGKKNNVWFIDDYAHNPAKCAAAIKGVQALSNKVVAWFQPHGYGPTRFLRNDFVQEIAAALRSQDQIIMSEIFYAGGTAVKDISAADLINDLKAKGCNAFFVEDRNDLVSHLQELNLQDAAILLMGARDPSLATFAKNVFEGY